VNVSGKTVFLMLFAVAVAFSIDPVFGALTFTAMFAATNRDAVVRAYRALDDAARRVERQLEQRGWLPTPLAEGVTTHHINKEEDVVVTVEDQTPAVTTPHINKKEDAVVTAAGAVAAAAGVTTPAPAAVTTHHINKRNESVVTLPPSSLFNPTDRRPARFAVPLGRDQTGAFRWLDFRRDALHVGLYGTSGCGKDHLLRLWFTALLNEPAAQWAILDGKGDWLTPNIARLPQMLFPPAGGYGDEGQQRIVEAIGLINEEAKRRFGLLMNAGVRSVEEYNQAAPEPLPLLIVLATDIIDVVDETERLLIALVSKARALGIRAIISMQTPTGKRLEWRMNLSTLISGALVDGSQDAPALGVRDPKALLYRPSQLPPPPGERGLFVVRHNNEQFLIRTPALVGDFDALIDARNDAALLETLLAVTTPHINKEETGVVTFDSPVPPSPRVGDEIEPSQRFVMLQNALMPVPAHQQALGRNEGVNMASQSAGTAIVPSPSPNVPVPTVPEPAENAQNGGFSESGDGWDGDGDETAPSRGFVTPQNTPNPVPRLADALGRNEGVDTASESLGTGIDPSPTVGDGDDTLIAALAALRRAGINREQARALGARFRNDDWARAARLLDDNDE